ncbi:MAG: hypothetical protein GY737_11635 [Desulfobacteraceae bacterium]|nr:hypothetical protein [Desulfobacteraceae bacterium]
MNNIWLISGITLKEGFRNRILHGIFFFVFALFILDCVMVNLFTRDLGKVAVDIGLSTMSISGLVIIFFMGMNLLSRDIDKLTIYSILSRSVARWQYIFGKYLGLSLLIFISVAAIAVLTAVFVETIIRVYPDYIPPLFSWVQYTVAVGLAFLSLLMVTAISILFTCLTSSPFMALLFTFGSYLIGQNIDLLVKLMDQSAAGANPLFIIIKPITWVMPNLSLFDYKTIAAYGLALNVQDIIFTVFYGITYIMLVLFASVLIFNRRELT